MSSIPTHSERLNARRNQIIKAARHCFRRSGFHGAGMAEIAKNAALSVGQIYRYFANKDAIIEEIVTRIVNNKLQLLSQGGHHHAAMATGLAQRAMPVNEVIDEDDDALMLEVAAEATRNPRVAEILHNADARLFEQACAMLTTHYPQLAPDDIAARVELMAVLSEGTMFRAVTPLKASAISLQRLYQQVFHHIFPEITPHE